MEITYDQLFKIIMSIFGRYRQYFLLSIQETLDICFNNILLNSSSLQLKIGAELLSYPQNQFGLAIQLENSSDLDEFLSSQRYKMFIDHLGTPGFPVDNIVNTQRSVTKLIKAAMQPMPYISHFKLFNFIQYRKHRLITQKVSKYLQYFILVQKEKKLHSMTEKGFIYIDYLARLQKKIKQNENLQYNPQMQLILNLYELGLKNSDQRLKYCMLKCAQTISKLRNQQFNNIFDEITDSASSWGLTLASSCGSCVQSGGDLRERVALYNYLEASDVNLLYVDDDEIITCGTQVIRKLFGNVTKRLQVVYTLTFAAIVHVVPEDNVYVVGPYEEGSLYSYGDNVCDVIVQGRDPWQKGIKSQFEQQKSGKLINYLQIDQSLFQYKLQYTGVGQLRLRSLNYNFAETPIVLKYPMQLISVSLIQSQIINISECKCIKNLLSERNLYKYDDIKQLSQLKRFQSTNDQYIGTDSMLLDLFQNNKLEFVHIVGGTHISDSTKLWNNIENLRCLQIKSQEASVSINISQCFPSLLQIFYIYQCRDGQQEEENDGVILGPTELQQQLQKQLFNPI